MTGCLLLLIKSNYLAINWSAPVGYMLNERETNFKYDISDVLEISVMTECVKDTFLVYFLHFHWSLAAEDWFR